MNSPPKKQQTPSATVTATANAADPSSPLYYPTIFRYKCRGGFFVSSDEPGSNGVCRGIVTHLQHVRDLQLSNKDESLHHFLQDYVPSDSDSESPSRHPSSPHDSILDLPAIIYNEKEESKQAILDGGATSSTTTTTTTTTTDSLTPKSSSLLESDNWHDWSCFGSTEVQLLVLRDAKTNQETTAAVAPNCRLGLSVRDVGNAEGGDTVATIRVGSVEVVLRNQYEMQEAEAAAAKKHQLEHDQQKGGNQDPAARNQVVGSASTSILSVADIVKGGEKVYASSQKVAGAMKRNAGILREAVREDFPRRTWDASHRVVGEFGKTFDRTTSLMRQLYGIWNDDDDDKD